MEVSPSGEDDDGGDDVDVVGMAVSADEPSASDGDEAVSVTDETAAMACPSVSSIPSVSCSSSSPSSSAP